MEFVSAYLGAMRERAPKMFNQLRRSGALDAHVHQKAEEARRLFNELTADAPKLPNGLPKASYRVAAEQQVMETLIEFPSENEEPRDLLGRDPTAT